MGGNYHFPRRQFLYGSAQVLFGMTQLPLLLASCRPAPAPVAATTAGLFFSRGEVAVLRQLMLDVLPGSLSPTVHEKAAAWLDHLLSLAPLGIRQDIHHLFTLFEKWPVLSLSLVRYSQADVPQRERILSSWEQSPLAAMRRGGQTLKHLVATALYAQEESWPSLGYAGPWVGRLDVGYGLDNQQPAVPVNPRALAPYPDA